MEHEKLKTDIAFPNYDLVVGYSGKETIIYYVTYIRKKHEDIWYLKPIRMNYQFSPGLDREQVIIEQTRWFISESYKYLLFYIIDPEMSVRKSYGIHPMIFVDENQYDEKTRLGIGL